MAGNPLADYGIIVGCLWLAWLAIKHFTRKDDGE